MADKMTTKRLLADHLKTLMTQKSIERISIADITTSAGVNRQTFYYHFENIYDLLKWALQQETIVPLQLETVKSWQQGLLGLFTYLEENRAFALSAVHSLGHDLFKRFFYTEVNAIISNVIELLSDSLIHDKKYLDFLSHYYTLSLSSLAISWLQGEMDFTPKEIIHYIDRAIQEQTIGGHTLSNRRHN